MTDERIARLAAATEVAAAGRRVPVATYRLQLHAGFTLAQAAALTDYLHALGVSHVYLSPVLAARPGSTHGYDAIDHGRLNPEIGTEAELTAWADELKRRGMGLLLDTVPNHMAAAPENGWWQDVLEHGPASPFAGFFDIAWQDHPRERLRGKVLLPILGDPYGQVLESGGFRPGYADGGFFLELYGRRLPLDPRTYGAILGPAVEAAAADFGPDDPSVAELRSILTAVRNLPSREISSAEGRAEATVVKRRLAALADREPAVFEHVRRAILTLTGVPGDSASFAALDELIEAQAYRACFWRVASDEINYRRFFDINDLAALSVEREDVFVASHRLLLKWLADGVADGLRIDHPDGLFDPKEYLDRLQLHYRLAVARKRLEDAPDEFAGLTWAAAEGPLRESFRSTDQPLYVVVEKILGHGEALPADWATTGTTGYDFLAKLNGLFADPAAEAAVTGVYERFTGIDTPYEEVVYQNKQLILRAALTSELHMLAHQLDRLAQAERWSRDFTLNGLRHALREVIANFPVYRTYMVDGVSEVERVHLLRAVVRARRRNPTLGRRIFDFVRDTLLLKDPPSGAASAEYRAAQRRFAGKFEQVTAPVTAKGIEDTTFYVFNRLVSLNEVGGEPGRFGTPPSELHAYFVDRAARSPFALSPLATHDTKRGEDVRARLNVLPELPADWEACARRWAGWNARFKTTVDDGVIAPDANEEYLLYQTLIGTWATAADRTDVTDRVTAYMHKALHEAKVHTSWINPDERYDAAVAGFVRAVLDPERSAVFLADVEAFARRVVHIGVFNSLAQTLIRCTAPGVPDTYQGTEFWDLSLVDPDNRRPVDFDRRMRVLSELDEADDRGELCRHLLEAKADGRAKLYVMSRALRLRREMPDLFTGEYLPLDVTGRFAGNVFAYLRRARDQWVLVAVPRLVAGLLPTPDSVPLAGVWADTRLQPPETCPATGWENVFTGKRLLPARTGLLAADVFADFPVALLVNR